MRPSLLRLLVPRDWRRVAEGNACRESDRLDYNADIIRLWALGEGPLVSSAYGKREGKAVQLNPGSHTKYDFLWRRILIIHSAINSRLVITWVRPSFPFVCYYYFSIKSRRKYKAVIKWAPLDGVAGRFTLRNGASLLFYLIDNKCELCLVCMSTALSSRTMLNVARNSGNLAEGWEADKQLGDTLSPQTLKKQWAVAAVVLRK